MDATRLAPTVGIAGCLAYLLALAVPYASASGAALGAYYGAGPVSPLFAGLLALVTILVFAAGREARTDPDFAAGVALVFGLFVVALTLLWGLSVRLDAVAVSQYHRWVTVALALAIPASALWYARALRVL